MRWDKLAFATLLGLAACLALGRSVPKSLEPIYLPATWEPQGSRAEARFDPYGEARGSHCSPEFREHTDAIMPTDAYAAMVGSKPPFEIPSHYYRDTLWIDGVFFGCSRYVVELRLGQPEREAECSKDIICLEFRSEANTTLVLLSDDTVVHVEGTSTSTIFGQAVESMSLEVAQENANRALGLDGQVWNESVYQNHTVFSPPERNRFSAAYAIAVRQDGSLYFRKSMLVANRSGFFLCDAPMGQLPDNLRKRARILGDAYQAWTY